MKADKGLPSGPFPHSTRRRKKEKKMQFEKKDVAVLINGTYSAGFAVEPWAVYYGAFFPDMDAGAIGLAVSIDGGTTYYPVLDPSDGADAVLCASGSDPGVVDFSDWIRFLHQNTGYLARFTCASQTTKAVTITVMMRGE